MSDENSIQSNSIISDGAVVPNDDKSLLSPRNITFVLTILALILLVKLKPEPYWEILQFLAQGIPVTLKLTVGAFVLAVILGLIIALVRVSKIPVINKLAGIYIEIIYSIPLLVLLYFMFFVVLRFYDMTREMIPFLTILPSEIIVFGVCYSAYIAETFKIGIELNKKSKYTAAQAIQFLVPALLKRFIALLKDTTLASFMIVTDIFRLSKEYSRKTFEYFATFIVVILIYMILTLFLSIIVGLIDRKLTN